MNSGNLPASSLLQQHQQPQLPKPYSSSPFSGLPPCRCTVSQILVRNPYLVKWRVRRHCAKAPGRLKLVIGSLKRGHSVGIRSQKTKGSRREFHSQYGPVRAQEDSTISEGDGQADESENTANAEVGHELPDWSTRIKAAVSRGAARYYEQFLDDVNKEVGINYQNIRESLVEKYISFKDFIEKARKQTEEFRERLEDIRDQGVSTSETVRLSLWPQFVAWNQWELWKNVKQWDARRLGALLLYILLVVASIRGAYMSVITPRLTKNKVNKLANMYMEAIIPEPTAQNLRKLKKALWRKHMPEGLRVKKFLPGPDGEYHRDESYVGEDAWEDSDNEEELDLSKMIKENKDLTAEEKDAYQQLVSDRARSASRRRQSLEPQTNGKGDTSETAKSEIPTSTGTWQDRLADWHEVLERDKWAETFDSLRSKYVIPIPWPEYKANFLKEQRRGKITQNNRAFWVTKRWWKYRPELPYTYFLAKVEGLQVESAVYSADGRKLYVTMRDGFPSEYVVKIPADPYLFEVLSKCGVELDILERSSFSLVLRAFAVVIPGLSILTYIQAVVYRTREIMSEKIYDLIKMNSQQLILPEDSEDKARSQYKDVVVGGDVWLVLEEIMIYMRDPMKYHSKEVRLPRGILISGPPGTGKTLLARAIARESGLPFVFASGAEFVDSRTGSGREKVFEIFFTARANAPSFIFIDEIDALAGKHAEDDPGRRATFRQLLAELDGEPEHTDVDRFSLRQAVILICATNRPDELHDHFLRPGRIDREIHIGLPGEKERVEIFGVHSAGKRLADDVDFSKLVYRTIGFSGADIRNLINEAAIMAVRKGHEEIFQQDFIDVLEKQLFEGIGVVLTEDEQERAEKLIPVNTKRLLAVHEAGHILLAHLFPRFDWHAFTHLMPGGSESALTVYYPRQEMREKGYTTVGYLKMQMVVAHGGRCAERLLIGEDISDGGQDDLAQLSRIAREIAISPASPRLGLFPLTYPGKFEAPKRPDEVDLIPNKWDKPSTQIAQMSVELSELFTREVTRYIDETQREALEGLSKNLNILEKLVDVLLTRTKISGLEVEDIVKEMNPVMLADPMKLPDLNFDDTEMESPRKSFSYYQPLDIYPAPLHRC
ncbi:hypothetical protein O6H91_03G102400 [Diphasiastrum complanatum]|uniref:Uncharacterized protein n=1 Tax=Diphasiastrum complanatum TaxID=34168 RepID=A0ACC2EA37_DIPCM|nr:hypothetical protein O6H91_03G102400 [Diphasiastrum complanatum]